MQKRKCILLGILILFSITHSRFTIAQNKEQSIDDSKITLSAGSFIFPKSNVTTINLSGNFNSSFGDFFGTNYEGGGGFGTKKYNGDHVFVSLYENIGLIFILPFNQSNDLSLKWAPSSIIITSASGLNFGMAFTAEYRFRNLHFNYFILPIAYKSLKGAKNPNIAKIEYAIRKISLGVKYSHLDVGIYEKSLLFSFNFN
ncbi:MAG: hypothetical protein IT239_02985 [Bacteroidia bacterium]|nr:hypothetical protein [Bacteroidia bacterium]